MSRKRKKRDGSRRGAEVIEPDDPRVQPDWDGECFVCGKSPTLPLTGMCGPCTFGEADTAGGNWL